MRIAGTTSDGQLRGMLEDTLAGAQRALEPKTRELAHDGIAIGWTGAGEPNAHDDGDLACVVDGAVYNADRPDAEFVCRLHREHGFRGALERLNGDFAI